MGIKASKTYTVRDGDGAIWEVDAVSRKCSCGIRGACPHYKLIQGLLEQSKTARFAAISALHKELRRGDIPKALMWLRWCVHHRGEDNVKSYLRKIVFEETRSFKLYDDWCRPSAFSARDMVIAFCQSRKKWEVGSAKDVANIHNRASVDAVTAAAMAPITMKEIVRPPQDEFEFYRWFRLMFRIRLIYIGGARNRWGKLEDKKLHDRCLSLVNQFKVVVFEALEDLPPDRIVDKVVQRYCKDVEPNYNPMSAVTEYISGLWDSTGNDILKCAVVEPDVDAELYPAYVFDSHTAIGKGLVRQMDKGEIGPGDPLPPDIDLRWSGQLIGVWWRYQAYAQHGMAYKTTDWEGVDCTKAEWDMAMGNDRFWRGAGGLWKLWKAGTKKAAAR